jgi:hypothetical protein
VVTRLKELFVLTSTSFNACCRLIRVPRQKVDAQRRRDTVLLMTLVRPCQNFAGFCHNGLVFIGGATCAPSQVDVVGGEGVNLSAAVGTSLQRELNKELKIALEQHTWPNRNKSDDALGLNCLEVRRKTQKLPALCCVIRDQKLRGAPGNTAAGSALLAVCSAVHCARKPRPVGAELVAS